jgi:uncharacterized protein (TIGR02391 family)
MTVYGYSRDDFLELEPDEVGAAIFSTVVGQAAPDQIIPWNSLNQARTQHGEDVANVVGEGIAWLISEGFITPSPVHDGRYRLSRRGGSFDPASHVADERAIGLLRAAVLDDELRAQVLPSFRRGQYDQAVFAAFRVVEDRVRHASRVTGEVGVKLMRLALGSGKPLADPGLLPSEVVARENLFAGAMGVHRNATGHQIVDYGDPQEAAEAVLLANNLLRHLKRAVEATRGRGRPRARRPRTP